MNIGIIGLGLMGASFAKRLSPQKDKTIYGIDQNEQTIQTALELNIIKEGSTDPDKLIKKCNLIILALYPTMIKPWIVENQQYLESGTILMDISGVKTNIVEPVQAILREDLELISIHPMCGRESRGIDFAQADIFDNANYIIVPTDKNTPKAIKAAKQLGKDLRVKNISILSCEEHDRMIGFLSQLTHVIAVSLMNTHDNSHLVEYTGDSFRDLTRIATINEDLWSELFLLNKDILLDEIDQFLDATKHFRDSLEKEDIDEMKRLFIQSTNRRKLFNK
ncbi:prephenate dehydrogenase [Faecalitalea cylindroides]|uniref:prephenate dehydrogenase n=1 Tax=Faecalitalea cylindroides TaxID=39483 RepID=UPI00232DA00F|nr:prephenate dehydrogenase [Faecalitalea cylindroides]MDB7951623.1 prephenate dehydrogenase [Faecalitalea cylindroides]MDB7958468.1 prephenate dehydrogenase [Faecalitalea cylindroides]MDB7960352.1 prephenate dehydrogenase [Faecalitalea cylindroides]MDB7962222.1 prephenate dehydrogenase [Faecalitalea cylindroides]MDB7964093.1 prephenate dehydrogenase [Faecalitalea cylindroides]